MRTVSDPALLAGRGAVVSGGSRGIGRAVADMLCSLGAGVVVNGRDGEAVEETVAALPRLLEQVRGLGFGVVRATQLPSNRRDVFVVAVREG